MIYLQVVNERPVVLTNAQDTVIALRLTIPFGCQSGTERCFLDLNLFMPRTDQCEVVDVGIQTINVNPCGVRFYNNETGMTKFIRLRTIIPQRIVPQKRIIKANMLTQRIYAAHPIFGGYLVKSFMVSI